MIKDNQKYFNRLTLIMDFLVIMFSYFVAWYLKFKTPLFDAEHEYGVSDNCAIILSVVCFISHVHLKKNSGSSYRNCQYNQS